MDKLVEQYTQVPANQRYLIAALVLGGLVGGYYYLFYADNEYYIEELHTTLESKTSTRVEKEKAEQFKEVYEAKIAKLQDQLDEARAKLPDKADVPQLLAQIGDKSRHSGLLIEEFTPLPEKRHDFYAEIGFNIKGKGSYHEIAMFIDSLAKLDRIVNVSNLEMTNPTTQASKIVVDTKFLVKTYRFAENAKKKKKK